MCRFDFSWLKCVKKTHLGSLGLFSLSVLCADWRCFYYGEKFSPIFLALKDCFLYKER